MKRLILTTLAALGLIWTGLAQADETVSIKVGYMILSPSGQFGATTGGPITAAGKIDLQNDLGFKDSKQPIGEIALQFGDSRLSAGFVPLTFDGAGTIQRTITYNGQTFTAGSNVTSSLKADIFDLGYTYYLVNMDDLPSRAQLGIEAAVKLVNAKTSMSGAPSKNATVPIPTIGLRGRIALADFVGITGRVGYLGYSGNSFTDIDGQLEFSPLPTLGIYAGYRQIQLKVDSSGVFADTTFKGPFAGAFFRF